MMTGSPFENKERKKPYFSANVLLLTPGALSVITEMKVLEA